MKRRWKALAGCLLPVAGLAVWLALPLGDDFAGRGDETSLTLTDRHGLPLRTTRSEGGARGGWIALDEMDPQLIQSFIALEDRRFYHHSGVDARAVGRAVVQAVRARRVVSGASTITMQLARLKRLPGASSRTWAGKVGQSLWALRLDLHLTKQQILEQYLNRVPLGQGTIGVAAAAALYFDADASHLSLGQAALLAGLASRPAGANPLASADRAGSRRRVALSRMVALGFASAEAADVAALEPVNDGRRGSPFLAPHFTSRVLQWADDSGFARAGELRASIDLALQGELEAEVRHTVSLLAESEVREGSAVVLDNASGEILAWVGSPDFFADTSGQVDMVVSPRQPGSALKPFLYALAFDRGHTAASVLPDVPRTYRTATGPYQPRNYDRRFHGPVLAREALASSFNVPAVELTERLGAAALLRVLHQAGMRSLTAGADRYGLGLALGNGDVTLLEMANGYRGLANGGVWSPVTWRASAPGERSEGTGASESHRFASAGAAILTLDILSDPVARLPGFGLETPFDFPFPVAVKTGTSHHFTDNWAVGVAGNFTVAVWVGNFSGRPMKRVSGVTGAGPLLHRAVLAVSRRYAPGVLPSPEAFGATRARICRLSGEIASADCPGTDEWFLPGTAPAGDCTWHRQGGAVALPAEYAGWAQSSPAYRAMSASGSFEIVSPRDGDRYEIPPGIEARYATLPLRAIGQHGDLPVRWWVDGEPARSDRWPLRSGTHAIRAVSASGRSSEVTIHVR